MIYRPEQDRSEEFGWTKFSEQHEPSQEEQQRWSWYSLLICIVAGIAVLVLEA